MMLDELLTELVCTARPWNPNDYDRDCQRDNLVCIATSARNSNIIPLTVKDRIIRLTDELITGFESNLNNWRVHNLFCIALHKLLIGVKSGFFDLKILDFDQEGLGQIFARAA